MTAKLYYESASKGGWKVVDVVNHQTDSNGHLVATVERDGLLADMKLSAGSSWRVVEGYDDV